MWTVGCSVAQGSVVPLKCGGAEDQQVGSGCRGISGSVAIPGSMFEALQ
jgi:hypothetical protein